MNQYYNYKKWRLSKLGQVQSREGGGRRTELEYTRIPTEGGAENIDKESINKNPEAYSPYTSIILPHNSPTSREQAEEHINNLLHDFRYAGHTTYLSPYTLHPTLSLNISPYGGSTRNTLIYTPSGSPILRPTYHLIANAGMENALPDYAGAHIFSLLHGTGDPSNKHSQVDIPGMQDIMELGEYAPKDIDDIISKHFPDDKSVFNPKNIRDNNEGDFTLEKKGSAHPHTRLKELLAPVLASETSKAYRKWLETPEEDRTSFLDFLKNNRDNMFIGREKEEGVPYIENKASGLTEDILHRMLVSILEGHHLPDKGLEV